MPKRVFFEPDALKYELGVRLRAEFEARGIPILMTTSHNRVTKIPGDTRQEAFFEAKRTLVVGIRRSKDFQTSKPSADYALPLVTGCPGHCQYCYLNTSLGNKPYVRIYVNLDEILARADRYISENAPKETVFDGSCTADPVVVEPWSGALRTCIEHFAQTPHGRFRFVTKYDAVDGLLDADHRERTEIRFSINSEYVIKHFEKAVASLERRLNAARKVAEAGYPLGFLIGPIMEYEGWQDGYANMLEDLAERLNGVSPKALTFELVTHRFTPKAKRVINEVYPDNRLPMDEAKRQWKWGQFGYGKYLYTKDTYDELRAFFYQRIPAYFPEAEILYMV